MTYHQASNLLDLRRAGRDMPPALVDEALSMTGDLLPDADEVAEAMQSLARSPFAGLVTA